MKLLEKILKSAKKWMITPLVLGVTLNPFLDQAFNAYAKEKEKKIHYSVNAGLDLRYEPNLFSISTVPEYIRNVPVHPDGWGFDGIINDSGLKNNQLTIEVITNARIKYNLKSYELLFGGGLRYIILSSVAVKERNYHVSTYSESRGIGAALTYYGFTDGGLLDGLYSIRPELFFRLSKKLLKEKGMDDTTAELFLQYNLEFFNANLNNGWDRYSRFQVRERYKLASMIENTIKLGICGSFDEEFEVNYFIGCVFPYADVTSLGKETGFKTQPHLITGLGFTISILHDNKFLFRSNE